jgi:hypothetical protein
VLSTEHGVGIAMHIEADSPEQADERFEAIGSKVRGFHWYCDCCGTRWDSAKEWDATDKPDCALGEYVHYADGTFVKYDGSNLRSWDTDEEDDSDYAGDYDYYND